MTPDHGGPTADDLSRIYGHRFTDTELQEKTQLWQVLCQDFFQRYVPANGTVVDLGAGSCEFSNAVQAGRRIAVDLNPDTKQFAAAGVEVLLTPANDLSGIGADTVDTVFTSNFFEHLASREELLAVLAESHRILRSGGRIVVLMPNIRNLPGAYWDYLDHTLPLTHLSLSEALELTGFTVERVVPRFLPYTVKNRRLPPKPALVRAYLRFPLAWRILGKQMLVVGRRP